MLDPITAASLAASIISIVDFSLKTAAKCAQTYKAGSSTENKDLESSRQSLPNLVDELENQIRSTNAVGSLSKNEQALLDVAQKCKSETNNLIQVLESLKVSTTSRKWHKALVKGFKGIAAESKIKGIEENLRRYNDTLHTHLLVDLRRKHRITEEQLRDKQSELLAKIHAATSELKSEVIDQHNSTRQHVTEELAKQFRQLDAVDNSQNHYEKLLKSLEFPEIGRGRNDIADPYDKTCKWILNEKKEQHDEMKWHDFPTWLRSGSGIYWIQGKAGSGKSTLMNYVCDCEQTNEMLKEWAQGESVFRPTFFFWSSGSKLQQSSEGLLRSLLYQILRKYPELVAKSLLHDEGNAAGGWSDNALRKTLLRVVQSTTSSSRLCFFIDGLDEFSGDWIQLMALMHKLSSHNYVKLCLASRPENTFQASLGLKPSLQMQDFTSKDMLKYIEDCLSNFSFTSSTSVQESYEFRGLIQVVHEKADGVWQWVRFALQSVIKGRINCDSFEQLEERLMELPPDLESLYKNMLDRVEPRYCKFTKEILATVSISSYCLGYSNEPNIWFLAFLDSQLGGDVVYSPNDVAAVCQSVEFRWKAATMGLVEFLPHSKITRPSIWGAIDTGLETLLTYHNKDVQFSHKTIATFVKDHLACSSEHHEALDEELLTRKVRLAQARYVLWKLRYLADHNAGEPGSPFFTHFSMLELLIKNAYGSTSTIACTELDRILEKIDKHHESSFLRDDLTVSIKHRPSLDFMGFLAERGIYSYVSKRFDSYTSETTGFFHNKATYLLFCAVYHDVSYSQDEPEPLQLAQFLIDRGADPTGLDRGIALRKPFYHEARSPWDHVLKKLTYGPDLIDYIPYLRKFLRYTVPLNIPMIRFLHIPIVESPLPRDVQCQVDFSTTLLACFAPLRDYKGSSEVGNFCSELEAGGAVAEFNIRHLDLLGVDHAIPFPDAKRSWNTEWISLLFGSEQGKKMVENEWEKAIKADPIAMEVARKFARECVESAERENSLARSI